MALQIKTSAELALPTTIKAMLYGQAGAGKTTLALSMPSPLLLDFDGGVSRVNTSHLDGVAVAQIASWQEALELFNSDLTPYKTIVIDTAGKMLDYIINYKCGNRQPSIRDWGGINAEFNSFTRNLTALGKNVVYVAHRDSIKDGDTQIYVPMMRAKNFTSIVSELDLLGYVEMRQINGRVERTITFNPTERSEGKNACNLQGLMTIPNNLDANGNPTANNDFMTAQVLNPYLAMLQAKKDAQKAYNEALQTLQEEIAAIVDADSANEFIAGIEKYKGQSNMLAKARQLFSAKVHELNLTYNKDEKAYVAA